MPFGRGLYPNVWCLYKGQPVGASIHFIDEGIDTGDLIVRKETELMDYHTLQEVYNKVDETVCEIFFEVWNDIVARTCSRTSQTELGCADHYGNREDSEKLMSQFPNRWQTTVGEVKERGRLAVQQ